MKKIIILWRMSNACPRHKTPKVIETIIKLISYNMGKIPQDEILLTNVKALNFHSPQFLNIVLNIHLMAISEAMLRSTYPPCILHPIPYMWVMQPNWKAFVQGQCKVAIFFGLEWCKNCRNKILHYF